MEMTTTTPPRLQPLGTWCQTSLRTLGRRLEYWLIVQGVAAFATLVIGAAAAVTVVVPLVVSLFGGMLSGLALGVIGEWLAPLASLGLRGSIVSVACLTLAAVGYFFVLNALSLVANALVVVGFAQTACGPAAMGAIMARTSATALRGLGVIVILSLICLSTAPLFLLPFVVLFPGLSLAWYVAVIEDRGPMDALAHSWARTRGVRLAILGRWIVLMLAVGLALLLLTAATTLPVVGLLFIPLSLLAQLGLPLIVLAFGYTIYDELRPCGDSLDPPAAPRAAFWVLVVIGSGITLIGLPLFLVLAIRGAAGF